MEEISNSQERVGLFSGYQQKRQKVEESAEAQLLHYLELCAGQDSLQFWCVNKIVFPKLFPIAKRVLGIPASSAPIERVFSHGGIILRPHRSQLNEKLLASLLFLKCNCF